MALDFTTDPSTLGTKKGLDFESDVGFGEAALGGTLTGLRRNPLIRPIVDHIAEALPGVGIGTLTRMEERLSGSRTSDVFEFLGEFGPDLLIGGGAFGVGRAAATRGLAVLGRTALGRMIPGAARTAEFLGQTVGGARAVQPMAFRAAQIAGGAIGIGTYEGAREAAAGGEQKEVLRSAVLGAVLTLGFEGALVGGGRLLTRARDVDPTRVAPLFEKGQAVFQQAAEKADAKLLKLQDQIESLTGKLSQEESILTALRLPVAGLPEEAAEKLSLRAAQAGKRVQRFESKLLEKERRFDEVTNRRLALQEKIDTDPLSFHYTREQPLNARTAVGQVAQEAVVRGLRTIEGMRGSVGPSGAKFAQDAIEASSRITIGRSFHESQIIQWQDALRKAMGMSKRQARKDRAAFLDIFDAWERGGEDGVRAAMARLGRANPEVESALAVFREIDTNLAKLFEPLLRMGAERPLDLAGSRVARYLPHRLDTLPESQILEAFNKAGLNGGSVLETLQHEGIKKYASFDFNRLRGGTLRDKIQAGLPYDPNPWNNLFQYMNEATARFELGSRFGFRGELAPAIKTAMQAEGVSAPIANTMVDTILKANYHSEGLRRLSGIVTGFQTGSKLALAVIPNASQGINTLIYGGLKANVKGLANAVRGESRDDLLRAVALMESVVRGPGRAFGEATIGGSRTRAEDLARRFARFTLTRTGFSRVEAWNRMAAGSTTEYIVKDTVMKAFGRRLRGVSLDRARRRMESLGVNLDDVVRRMDTDAGFLETAQGRQILENAIFRGAQQTQFIPSATRRPILWNHPIGRMVFQFKSFALNQSRFISDQVFAEAARGNVAPLAYFLSIYPIAGELVGDVRNAARGRDRKTNGVARLAEDFMYVGGMGLFTDTFVAARHGRLLSTLFGPTVGDMTAFTEAFIQGRAESVGKEITNEPIFQLTRSLLGGALLTGGFVTEYLDATREDATEGETPELALSRFRQIQQKGQP